MVNNVYLFISIMSFLLHPQLLFFFPSLEALKFTEFTPSLFILTLLPSPFYIFHNLLLNLFALTCLLNGFIPLSLQCIPFSKPLPSFTQSLKPFHPSFRHPLFPVSFCLLQYFLVILVFPPSFCHYFLPNTHFVESHCLIIFKWQLSYSEATHLYTVLCHGEL